MFANHLHGSVVFHSHLNIEAVGSIISLNLFSGIPFGGLGDGYFEGVSVVYIEHGILGLQISIQKGRDVDFDRSEYFLDITPSFSFKTTYPKVSVNLSLYLHSLFSKTFADSLDIFLVEPFEG